jgi:hypothetical protein
MFSARADAAACCGGGFSAPALILADEQASMTVSYSYGQIADDVSESGIWSHVDNHERTQIWRLDAAHIFWDRFQVGASLPWVGKDRDGSASASGLGDTSVDLGYEFLPDWDYNPWRPHGVGYLQLTLPTGKSKDESLDPDLDSRGRGYWALGAGSAFNKTLGAWDGNAIFEVHRAFTKTAHSPTLPGSITEKPGWGGSLALGLGWSFRNWHASGNVAWSYEDAIAIAGVENSPGSPERYATTALACSYLFPKEWTATVTYTDQTWFGNPSNTTLSRSLLVSAQHRWPR